MGSAHSLHETPVPKGCPHRLP